jgi:hypothetical protein
MLINATVRSCDGRPEFPTGDGGVYPSPVDGAPVWILEGRDYTVDDGLVCEVDVRRLRARLFDVDELTVKVVEMRDPVRN